MARGCRRAGPARPLAATLAGLAAAAALEQPADRAAAILAALDARCAPATPTPASGSPTWSGSPTRRRAQPSLHDALVELALDPPVSASDLAGPPRLDEDYLVISTVHSAKGLEWPVVHLPHLVDGAVPSDMALATPGGLAEERRLFYVATPTLRTRGSELSQSARLRPCRVHPSGLGLTRHESRGRALGSALMQRWCGHHRIRRDAIPAVHGSPGTDLQIDGDDTNHHRADSQANLPIQSHSSKRCRTRTGFGLLKRDHHQIIARRPHAPVSLLDGRVA